MAWAGAALPLPLRLMAAELSRFQNSSLLVRILIDIKKPTTLLPSDMLILPLHPRMIVYCGLFPSGFETKLCMHFSSLPMHAMCSPHIVLFLDFIALQIFIVEYKLTTILITKVSTWFL